MSVLPWGKPTVEVCKLENGAIPAEPEWKGIAPIQSGSTQLETEDGDTQEALEEGGGMVDMRRNKSKYTLTLAQYKVKGAKQVIPDDDGVIIDNYAVRVTPEDSTNEGILMPRAKVALSHTFSSEEGELLTWTFTALKPADGGKMLRHHLAGEEVEEGA